MLHVEKQTIQTRIGRFRVPLRATPRGIHASLWPTQTYAGKLARKVVDCALVCSCCPPKPSQMPRRGFLFQGPKNGENKRGMHSTGRGSQGVRVTDSASQQTVHLCWWLEEEESITAVLGQLQILRTRKWQAAQGVGAGWSWSDDHRLDIKKQGHNLSHTWLPLPLQQKAGRVFSGKRSNRESLNGGKPSLASGRANQQRTGRLKS